MKNKKTIAIATAALSVATVIPAFADTTQTYNNLEAVEVDVALARGKNYKVVEEKNLNNFLVNYKDRNPKKVVKKTIDGTVFYGVEIDLDDNVSNISDIAKAKVRLEEKKKEVTLMSKETYKLNGKDTPKYKVDVKEVAFDIENGEVIPAGKTVVLTDLQDVENIDRHTYNFVGMVGTYTEIVGYQEKGLTVTSGGYANKEDLKQLSKWVYEIEQAIAKGKVKVTTKENNDGTLLNINVFTKDGKTKLAQIKLNSYNEKIVKANFKRIPVSNDFAGTWAEKTIINAMLDGKVDLASKFRINDSITRAEFAKMMCKYFDIKAASADKEKFSDVKPTDWYYEYVVALVREGAINGYEDGTFRPNAPISREEAAKIMASMVAEREVETSNVDANGNKVHHIVKTKFNDTQAIAAWADQSVQLLSETPVIFEGKETYAVTGYKEGGKEYFKPANKITRAEALTMVARAEVAKSAGTPSPLK